MAVKGGLKFLRKRKRAIQNIEKITKAMKTVASVKLRKAQLVFGNSKSFIDELGKIFHVSTDVGKLGPKFVKENFDFSFLWDSSKEAKDLYIVIGADKGLCGAFNSNIVRTARENIKGNPYIWAFGKKIIKPLSKYFEITSKYEDYSKDFSIEKMESIYTKIEDMINKKEVSEIFCIYTFFKSPGTQYPVCEKIFPILIFSPWSRKKIFEPSQVEVVEFFAKLYLRSKLFFCFQSSITSEHASRMRAMDMANQNAKRLIRVLDLQINKARQESITKELIDIVNGKTALESASI